MRGNPRELKRRQGSVQHRRAITKAMEVVAAAKLQEAQRACEASQPYTTALLALAGRVATRVAQPHAAFATRPVRRAVVIVATSDRGLCGAFNVSLLRLAEQRVAALVAEGVETELYALGRKGVATQHAAGLQAHPSWSGSVSQPSYEDVVTLADALLARHASANESQRIDLVELVHQRFAGARNHRPHVLELLPLATDQAPSEPFPHEWVMHPDAQRLMAEVIPRCVHRVLFAALLQHAAGEYASRRQAMHRASSSADTLISRLGHAYSRARQAHITREIAEIVSAIEAMA